MVVKIYTRRAHSYGNHLCYFRCANNTLQACFARHKNPNQRSLIEDRIAAFFLGSLNIVAFLALDYLLTVSRIFHETQVRSIDITSTYITLQRDKNHLPSNFVAFFRRCLAVLILFSLILYKGFVLT